MPFLVGGNREAKVKTTPTQSHRMPKNDVHEFLCMNSYEFLCRMQMESPIYKVRCGSVGLIVREVVAALIELTTRTALLSVVGLAATTCGGKMTTSTTVAPTVAAILAKRKRNKQTNKKRPW